MSYLSPRLSPLQKARRLLKTLLYGPRGMEMGPGSSIGRPWTITNPSFVRIGARTLIGSRVTLDAIRFYANERHEGQIHVGDDVYIGHDCQFHAMGTLRIGNGCVLSDRVYINDALHGLDPRGGLIVDQPIYSKGDIHIGNHVFVGVGSVILSGVTLGDHCVVAAQSVVTRSQPAGSMLAGNPARVIKTFDFAAGKWIPVIRETAG
jgi:serine acetyltransferase